MERNLSFNMTNSNNSNTNSPQQKLRKISFNSLQLDQYINNFTSPQNQNVDAWGNQKWDPNNSTFHINKHNRKSLSKRQIYKNTQSPKKLTINKDQSNDRNKYIQKLEEKLIQLVNIKNKLQIPQSNIQNSSPHYLTPKKQNRTGQRTNSTSQSQCQKLDHNFTNTFIRKQNEKDSSFKIRKTSKQFKPDISLLKFNQLHEQMITTSRINNSKSMLTSYKPLSQRLKQVSMISYPVIDNQRRPRRSRKLSKLQDFKQTFSLKRNVQESRSIFEEQKIISKKQNSLFKIKISEPKIKDKKLNKLQF